MKRKAARTAALPIPAVCTVISVKFTISMAAPKQGACVLTKTASEVRAKAFRVVKTCLSISGAFTEMSLPRMHGARLKSQVLCKPVRAVNEGDNLMMWTTTRRLKKIGSRVHRV